MSITHYLKDTSGVCGHRGMSSSLSGITKSISVLSEKAWDTPLSGIVESGQWRLKLFLSIDAEPGSEDIFLQLLRLNSSCSTQEVIGSTNSTITAGPPTSHTFDFNSVPEIVFNPGDRIKLRVRQTSTNGDEILIAYDSGSRDSLVQHPDFGPPVQELVSSISALSTVTAIKLEDDLLRAAIAAQSGVVPNIDLEAVGSVAFFGASEVETRIETGVFIEALIHGASLFEALLDSILEPLPKVIPVGLDGRSRWVQFRFSGTGSFDLTIPGFMLYAREAGQDNVDEP